MFRKRLFILSLLSMSHVHTMEEVAQPLFLQDLAHLEWPMQPYHANFNDYWFPEELLRDPIAKRLSVSPQEVKEQALYGVCDSASVEKRYKAACCIAAGAKLKLPLLLERAVAENRSNFVATLEPFKPDPNAMKTNYRVEWQQSLEPGGQSTRETIPLFFRAQTRKMAKWLWILGANYANRGGVDGGTVLHWLCTCPPANSKEALKLLSFYLDKGVDPKAVDSLGRTALHCVARNPMANSWFHEYATPFIEKLLAAGIMPELKDKQNKTYMDYLKGNVTLLVNKSSPDQYDKYLRYQKDAYFDLTRDDKK